MSLPLNVFINSVGTEGYYGPAASFFLAPVKEPTMRQAYSAGDFTSQLVALLPEGGAWPRDPGSALQALMRGLAAELARIDARAVALTAEADPRITSELISEWERQLGLPDPCAPAAATLDERRAAVVIKLVATGSQSRAFFIDLATRLGYAVTLDEFFSEGAAIAGGIPYTGTGWAYTWRMNVDAEVGVTHFRAGSGRAGEPIRAWEIHPLECQVRRSAPAHTRVLFAYSSFVVIG